MAKSKTERDAVAYRYVAERNPEGAFLPGVALRDLSAAEVAEMPGWLRTSIEGAPFYVAVESAERPATAPGKQTPGSAQDARDQEG